MICDKCGKSNIQGLSKCSYCGADMPKTAGGGGFADVLSYGGKISDSSQHNKIDICKYEKECHTEGISESNMQKLIKKSDNIIKSTQKNTLFVLITIGLCFLILLSSIVFGFMTINSVKDYKKETMTQIEETEKEIRKTEEELSQYKSKLDKSLEKLQKSLEKSVREPEEDEEVESSILEKLDKNDKIKNK